MDSDHKIKQGSEKESPTPQILVGIKTGEKQDAANDEDNASSFVQSCVECFPAKLFAQIFSVRSQIVQTRPVGKHVGHNHIQRMGLIVVCETVNVTKGLIETRDRKRQKIGSGQCII
jgi:hypothetical protein